MLFTAAGDVIVGAIWRGGATDVWRYDTAGFKRGELRAGTSGDDLLLDRTLHLSGDGTRITCATAYPGLGGVISVNFEDTP